MTKLYRAYAHCNAHCNTHTHTHRTAPRTRKIPATKRALRAEWKFTCSLLFSEGSAGCLDGVWFFCVCILAQYAHIKYTHVRSGNGRGNNRTAARTRSGDCRTQEFRRWTVRGCACAMGSSSALSSECARARGYVHRSTPAPFGE